MSTQPNIEIRPARANDVPELVCLLNQIIERGGTTAYQKPLSEAEFSAKFFDNASMLGFHVACLESGQRLGFQHLQKLARLPDDWGDIATFALIDSPVRGIGTALFEATKATANQLGLNAINATIRADNVPGLGYYSKMGFVDYSVAKAVPLSDGTPVDRISKKYLLK